MARPSRRYCSSRARRSRYLAAAAPPRLLPHPRGNCPHAFSIKARYIREDAFGLSKSEGERKNWYFRGRGEFDEEGNLAGVRLLELAEENVLYVSVSNGLMKNECYLGYSHCVKIFSV